MSYFIGDTLAPDEQSRMEQQKLEILNRPGFDQTTKAVLIRELWLTNGLEPGTWRRRGAGPESAQQAVAESGASVNIVSELKMLKYLFWAGLFFIGWMFFSSKAPETASVIHNSFWDLVEGLTQNGFALWNKFCAWVDAYGAAH